MMKNIGFLSLLLWALWLPSQAQGVLGLQGKVLSDPISLVPLSGYPVNVDVYVSGSLVTSQILTTDSNGQFNDSILLAPAQSVGWALVSLVTCAGQISQDSLIFTPATSIYYSNLVYYGCDTLPNSGSCASSFMAIPAGSGTFTFVSTSSPSSGGNLVSLSWDLGQGLTLAGDSLTFTFAQSGVYNVCLTIIDDQGCVDISCQPVVVGTPGGSCSADFSYIPLNSNQFLFIGDSLTPPNATHFWDFGDGNTSTQPNPLHTFGGSGSFFVCYTVSDSLSGCTDQFCDTVSLVPNCQAAFIWTPTAGGAIMFDNISQPATPGVQYLWDFGDSTTSTASDPSHIYSGTGPWNVCLTLIDSLTGCVSTTCQQVGPAPGGPSLYGLVLADSLPALDAIVYLIQHDNLNGTLTAVDSILTVAGLYGFDGLTPGTYLLKAALTPASPAYANYLPTYFGDELFWDDATSLVVTNTPQFLPPLQLIAGTNPGGPGFIGGLISQGANKQAGDALANMSVLLLDAQDQAVSHTLTDSEGAYSFAGLAYGTYKVYVEMAGMSRTPWIVTLSPDDLSADNLNFEMSDGGIHPATTTSLDRSSLVTDLNVYPNPADAQVQIAFTLAQAGLVELALYNTVGQQVQQQAQQLSAGPQTLTLALDGLPAGAYHLQVRTAQGLSSHPLIKR